MVRFGEVCAGISAASVAWGPLGWTPAWFSEIDPFASAVLNHHHPDVPNHGDFTELIARPELVSDIDILMGGCPCQAFSIAGLHGSLSDDRGNLTLQFIRLANAIDNFRRSIGKPPIVVVYENVPGIFSAADNPFGCFLAGLVGGDAPIAPRDGWTDAGVADGPDRCAAWRILDAQHFGLAQRRKRVFVVACSGARKWAAPDALLPIIESLSWHPAPSRETRESVTGTLAARTKGGGGLGTNFEIGGGLANPLRAQAQHSHRLDSDTVVPASLRGGNTSGSIDLATARNAKAGARLDFDSETFVTFDDFQAFQTRGSNINTDAEITGTIGSNADRASGSAPCIAYRTTGNAGCYETGDQVGSLGTQTDPNATVLAWAENSRAELRIEGGDGQTTGTLKAGGGKPGQGYPVVSISLRGRDGGGTAEITEGPAPALKASSGGGDKPHVLAAMTTRRLTPKECARLQGFADDYLSIQYRSKIASDGPMYKAFGNSIAVPCLRYIGKQINSVIFGR